ncbi:hypothetical protein PHMEG_00039436 [Phytophthora megakarya]|uniref:MSP domain-containing protein n=1 Tax=Phytophthora megakarya TaxID=4795 RepID=A0A225UFR3_9STRA|nr:hypothetical protein PHMEG_00039436 [Phytophthora megakarya]
MVDVVLPLNSSVILEPADSVAFYLTQASEPHAMLTIQNVSDAGPIAFKVKTKRPNCYLVRPPQGFLEPNASISITLILLQSECNNMLHLDATSRHLMDDKFLVQSVEVDQSFYKRTKKRGTTEMKELAKLWTQVDRQSIANDKLRCRFYLDTEDELQQLKQLRQSEVRGETSPTLIPKRHAQIDKNQDLVALQKKYDELMVQVAQLTTQRDTLANDLAKTQQKLNEVSTQAHHVREGIEGAIQTSVYEF